MSERMAEIGGTMGIESKVNAGTKIIIQGLLIT